MFYFGFFSVLFQLCRQFKLTNLRRRANDEAATNWCTDVVFFRQNCSVMQTHITNVQQIKNVN